jgi:hypothetical protein
MGRPPRMNRRKRAFTRARMPRRDDDAEAREIARGLGLLYAADAELTDFTTTDSEETPA